MKGRFAAVGANVPDDVLAGPAVDVPDCDARSVPGKPARERLPEEPPPPVTTTTSPALIPSRAMPSP